ncbi:acylphosphatase-1 [Copidosoma floridanum]|uniref:acylphosphatase-1 n=1 Tax=Copidosoma floridanum TaxID=29053 RepID=UPI0006C93FD2|nr:acylphosphatase-1 [Copidosoma floridanum]
MIVIDYLKKFEVHSTLIIAFLILVRQISEPEKMPATNVTRALDFEVYGRVQRVFFRKHTQEKAKELGLTGWCMNTKQGTVLGYMEGDKDKVEEMKNWLKHTGSPQSNIDKAEFRNEKEIDAPTLEDFVIKKVTSHS